MAHEFQEQHALLASELNQFIFDHPEFAQQIPDGAVIVLQLAGDEAYNAWSRRLAESNREPGRSLVIVEIQGLAPIRSRLVNPIIKLAS